MVDIIDHNRGNLLPTSITDFLTAKTHAIFVLQTASKNAEINKPKPHH